MILFLLSACTQNSFTSTNKATTQSTQPADAPMETVPAATTDDTTDAEDVCAENPELCGLCDFNVEAWDGVVTMYNTLTASLSADTASGPTVPGFVPVLTLRFHSDDATCTSLDLFGFMVTGWWTDNADSGWEPDSVTLVDETGTTIEDGVLSIPGNVVYAGFNSEIVIPPGGDRVVTVWADLSGASAPADDTVEFRLYLDSLGVDDGYHAYVLKQEEIVGGTLEF